MGIIYKATNTITGESYIGQSKKSLRHRKFDHEYEAFKRKTTGKFYDALREFGTRAFEWVILDECDDYDKLSKMEIKYIKKFNTIKYGYNAQLRNDAAAVRRINYRNYRNNFQKAKEDAELAKYIIPANFRDSAKVTKSCDIIK